MKNNELTDCKTQSPVLIIGFNRPDYLQQVFNAVRNAKPIKLYFAVDGPRDWKEGERDKVAQVRDIIKQVDWACEVHTLFREENLGCGRGPAEAISWSLEHEDRIIVLEDDCVPSRSFFRFCDEMLERYKNDTRINIVSGRSHWHGSHFFDKYDYLFTRYAHTWGWATWKRAWDEFDMNMNDVSDFIAEGGALNVEPNATIGKRKNKSLLKKYKTISEEITHSWDSQWAYTRLKTGLGIVPSRNLIHNIGSVGTHSDCDVNRDMVAEEMPEILRHPRFIMVNRVYEDYHYRHHIQKKPSLIRRVWNKLGRVFRKFAMTRSR